MWLRRLCHCDIAKLLMPLLPSPHPNLTARFKCFLRIIWWNLHRWQAKPFHLSTTPSGAETEQAKTSLLTCWKDWCEFFYLTLPRSVHQTFGCVFIEARPAAPPIYNLFTLDGKSYGLVFFFSWHFGKKKPLARDKRPHSVFSLELRPGSNWCQIKHSDKRLVL